MTNEPNITINGVKLSEGEAMTVRVGLNMFASDLKQNGLGEDVHGRLMTDLYLKNLRNLIKMMC